MSLPGLEYLRHILEEADYLGEHSRGLTREEFLRDETLRRAFARSLEINGEAARSPPGRQLVALGVAAWNSREGFAPEDFGSHPKSDDRSPDGLASRAKRGLVAHTVATWNHQEGFAPEGFAPCAKPDDRRPDALTSRAKRGLVARTGFEPVLPA